MPAAPLYVVDADVFITAKNRYYAFELCPGFWQGMIRLHGNGDLCSIDRVRGELLVGRDSDELVQWVRAELPPSFFRPVDEGAVVEKYSEIMMWAQRNPRFMDSAKAKFATGADGWLVAFCAVHGATVVTNEQPAPWSKRDIKIPDVCGEFDVEFMDVFAMLRNLGARFVLATENP